ncbi:MAG: type II toxin-antitoxin system VapC family toxin [Alphaproteobacteria bacterium]|nr:type II toxin-antitoxin system VapC family toxin [Alphaproteobacteria bacterium]
MKGLDTNVLVRAVVKDDARQSGLARRFLERESTPEEPCFINRIVLCELVWVLETSYQYHRDEIADILEKILLTTEFVVENADQALSALRAYRAGRVGFADGLLGSTNRAQGCEITVTFDRDAARLGDFDLLSG